MIRTTEPQRPVNHLSDEVLSELLTGDDHSNSAGGPVLQLESTWDHLESCEACRGRLDKLAGDVASWSETRDMLKSVTDAVERVSEPAPTVSLPTPSAWSQSFGEMQHREFTQDVLPILRQMPDYHPADETDPTSTAQGLGTLGEYKLTGVIGWGGTGVVLSAADSSLGRSVAIKVLYPHLAARGSARQRFEREARSVASLSHPAIMPIHRVVAEAGPPYLVLAHIRGGSLQDKVDREGPLELETSLSIAMQIADALSAAHRQGVVHRDVKPGNILLEEDGHRVVLSDFGLAQTLDEMQLTASGMIAGTPPYMSPEQAGGRAIDPRSDLFSLGSVLYSMWTGREPFRRRGIAATLVAVASADAVPANQIRRDLPPWAIRLLESFHAIDPDDRIANAKEAKDRLESCLAHVRAPNEYALPEDLNVAPDKAHDVTWKSIALIAGLVLFACLAIAAASGFFGRDENPATSNSERSDETSQFSQRLPDVLGQGTSASDVDRFLQFERATDWEDTQWDQDLWELEQEMLKLKHEMP